MTDPFNGLTSFLAKVYEWLDSFSALVALGALILLMQLVKMLWVGAKTALPKVKAAVSYFEAQLSLPTFMAETRSQLGEIRHEVFPNAGGSFRDDVETLTLMVDRLNAKVDQLGEHDASDHLRIKALEDTIDRRRDRRAELQRESDAHQVFPADTSED